MRLAARVLTLMRIATAGVAMVTACTHEEAPRFVAHDSARVSIRESRSPQWDPGMEWRVGDVQQRFETSDVNGVVGALRLTNGTVVVGDEGGGRLLYFGADGRVLKAVGRSGDGPGEFRLLQAIGRTADGDVWAYDFALRRVARLDSAGLMIEQVALTPPMASGLAVGSVANGVFFVVGQWRTSGAKPFAGRGRDTVAILRYDKGTLADTLAVTPGREFVQRPDATGRTVMIRAVMARSTSTAVWGGFIVFGDQVGHSLHVVSPDGGNHRLIRWAGRDLAVTAADVTAWVDSQVAAEPQSNRESLRALLMLAEPPDRRPAYGRLIGDALGNLWVGEYAQDDTEPTRWDVFNGEGAWLGIVRMPSHFRPFDIGGPWVLGSRRDESGVEHVELRTLHR